MVEKNSPVGRVGSGEIIQHLASRAWNISREKLGLEFSAESEENLLRFNEQLATNSGVLYINHTSWLDAPIMVSLALKYFTNAAQYFGPAGMKHYDWKKNIFTAGFFRILPVFQIYPLPIIRSTDGSYPEGKKATLSSKHRTKLEDLNAPGSVYGIAPEGTRGDKEENGILSQAKSGIGYLAQYENLNYLPIVTVYRKYFNEPFLRVGEPLKISEIVNGSQNSPQEIADAHMYRLAAMLPQPMRGYYS